MKRKGNLVEEAALAYNPQTVVRKAANVIPFPASVSNKGGKAPIYQWSPYLKMDIIRTGLSKTQLEAFKTETTLDYETISGLLGVTKATLHNKKGADKFDSGISERMVLLADIYSFGYEVFEDRANFNSWVKVPNEVLGGASPISLMNTVYGMQEVKNVIGRIAYGIHS